MQYTHPYKLLNKYPGLRKQDELIWDAFILSHPEYFVGVAYDVHIGDPCSSESERQRMKASGMFDVSQWCVDVVATDGKNDYIIELKPNAGAGALGQALAYKEIMVHENLVSPTAIPMVITDSISPIEELAATLLGVVVLV